MTEAVEAAIADLRTGLQSDGADLTLEEVGPDSIRVRLVLGAGTECSDCIMPKPTLTRVVQASLARHGVEDRAVELIDPRGE